MDEQELKLKCLELAGNVTQAKDYYKFVKGKKPTNINQELLKHLKNMIDAFGYPANSTTNANWIEANNFVKSLDKNKYKTIYNWNT